MIPYASLVLALAATSPVTMMVGIPVFGGNVPLTLRKDATNAAQQSLSQLAQGADVTVMGPAAIQKLAKSLDQDPSEFSDAVLDIGSLEVLGIPVAVTGELMRV